MLHIRRADRILEDHLEEGFIIEEISCMLSVNSLANVIKISAAILNLVSFSLFDRRDSDKPEMINITE